MTRVNRSESPSAKTGGRRNLLRDNGLLLACLGLFAVFFVGMIVSGAATYNNEQLEHGSSEQVSVLEYLTTGDFVEATFENWESEFLQMGMYVVRRSPSRWPIPTAIRAPDSARAFGPPLQQD